MHRFLLAILMLGALAACAPSADSIATALAQTQAAAATSTPRPAATQPPSATRRPTLTATQPPTPVPPKDSFSDDFSKFSSGWDVSSSADSRTGYRDGQYYLTVLSENWLTWANPGNQVFSQVHIEVTASNSGQAKDAGLGIICNYSADGDFYYLAISFDGYYIIVKQEGTDTTVLSDPANGTWLASRAISTRAESYQLGADCADGTLTLYLDGEQLASAQDDSLAAGNVGLIASTFTGSKPAEITFDDFVVTPYVEPAAATAPPLATRTKQPPAATQPGPQATQPPQATLAPTVAPTVAGGVVQLKIYKEVPFSVRINLWGPAETYMDLQNGLNVLTLPVAGDYGWQVFANNCELVSAGTIPIRPTFTLYVQAVPDDECGYQIAW